MFLFKDMLKFFAFIAFFVLSTANRCVADENFKLWLSDFKNEALELGISQKTLDAAFNKVVFEQEVINLDKKQPEFVRTFKSYIDNALSKERINQGKALMKKHKALLEEAFKLYGVPPQYLVAFWGMETFYGKNFGNINVFNSLATLSYDTRRSDFFKNELITALKIVENNEIAPEKMMGSWAGAMGNFQFMPSTFFSYAVDADNDGKKDLWNSLPDAVHSAGNYLSKIGWKRELSWGREVKLPKNFDYFLTGKTNIKTINEWQKLGIRNANNSKLPNSEINTWILLPAGYKGPAFFVYDNFDIIMKWNRSFLYSLAIGLLADNISGRALLINSSSKEDKITRTDIAEVQTKLKEKGLYDGEVDGILGSATKNAIQSFQKNINIPADGYPSGKVIGLLKVDSLYQNDIKKIPIPKKKPLYVAPMPSKPII